MGERVGESDDDVEGEGEEGEEAEGEEVDGEEAEAEDWGGDQKRDVAFQKRAEVTSEM